MTGADLARAAEALIGAPFRLHGRNAATGLDCIGVVTAAFVACGRETGSLPAYGLRNRSIAEWPQQAERAGLSRRVASPVGGRWVADEWRQGAGDGDGAEDVTDTTPAAARQCLSSALHVVAR